MPFLGHHHRPLTEHHIRAVLSAAGCTPCYRFHHLHAVDQASNEYHICYADHLATWSVRQLREALIEALSYRLREIANRWG
jgi:hypothetical protein